MSIGDELKRVHRQTAAVTAMISVAIERRRVRASEIADWARALRHAAETLEGLDMVMAGEPKRESLNDHDTSPV
jgi:hypothetical protein